MSGKSTVPQFSADAYYPLFRQFIGEDDLLSQALRAPG
jgi:hypothetical protein